MFFTLLLFLPANHIFNRLFCLFEKKAKCCFRREEAVTYSFYVFHDVSVTHALWLGTHYDMRKNKKLTIYADFFANFLYLLKKKWYNYVKGTV